MDATKILVKYKELLRQNPELARAIGAKLREARRAQEQTREIQEMVAHEIRNPLTSLVGWLSILEKNAYDSEKVLETVRRLRNNISQIVDINELLNLYTCSKEELQANSESINLEEIARNHAFFHEEALIKLELGINFKYDRPNNKPIQVYANKGVMSAVTGTLLGNCVNYAPKGSNINQGVRISNSQLELMFENETTGVRLRKGYGMGRGIGLPFAKMIIETLGGTITTYDGLEIDRNYDFCERIGYEDGRNPSDKADIFGLKILIPMSELNKPDD